MKILLIFPPWGDPTQPYSSLPCLYAYLKFHGLDVRQIDLNIKAHHYFLDKKRLLQSLEKIDQDLNKLQLRSNLSADLVEKTYKFQISSLIGPYVIENIDRIKSDFRNDEGFYNFNNYMRINYIFQKALELISNEFYPTEITPHLFSMDVSLEKFKEIEAAISNSEENPFIKFYERECINDIIDKNPSIVGISITYSDQFIPGLTLAKLVKETCPSTHVTIGGAFITKIGEGIKKTPRVFDIVDSSIIYDGEQPLLRLAEVLDNGESLAGVPNLIFSENNQVHATPIKPTLPISSLPTPLYEGLPLDLYFSPEAVLLIMESKGCYWKRCTFCDIPQNSTQSFQLKNVQKVIKEIVFHGKTYGAKNFFFSSNSLAPKFLHQFSDEVIRKGLEIYWQGELRFEEALTDNLLEKMAKAGCRNLIFGFESGTQRILDLMKKGTKLSTIERILKTCAKFRIGVNLQSFIGFPTETRDEAKDTVRFLMKNRDILGSVCFGYFHLGKLTDVFDRAEAYGVEPIVDPKINFNLFYPYRVKHGLTQDEIYELFKELTDNLGQSFYLERDSFATSGVTSHSLLYFANGYKSSMNHFKKENPDTNQIIIGSGDSPTFNGDKLILQETNLDMNSIAQIIEEDNANVSIDDLLKEQHILAFNKSTYKITQFRNSYIFWDLIHRLNGNSTLEQVYREICEFNGIYVEDDLFKEEFTKFIEFLFDEQIITIHNEKK